jgi:chromosome segregation ATPase
MLVRIREINLRRHDIAEREYLHQKSVVEKIRAELREKERNYKLYVDSIPQLEDEVFKKIFNKPVPDKDIDSYKSEIRKIHEHAEDLKEEIEAIKIKLQEEEKILQEKKEALQVFQKKIKKFDNLIEKQEEEQKIIASIKEDNEIEESFRPQTPK